MMTEEISMFQQRAKQRVHWASRSSFFLVSTSFAPWSSSSPIEFPSDILPFMYKKAFISGLQSFCAVSWIPLQSDWLLIYTWPVTLWGFPCSHLNNLLPTFPLIFASFTLWDGCKSFLSLLYDIFSCPSMNLFKAFPGFLQVTNFLKYYFQF